MDARFINPVLHSIVDVLTTMAQMQPAAETPYLKQDAQALGVVSGIIDMRAPDIHGSIAISFSKPVALEITRRMLQTEPQEIDDEIRDLVGEITNMMTGGAKAKLQENGYEFDLATPRVVSGESYEINHEIEGAATIALPFKTEAGEFFVEICFP
jgi:chemotaxis protein CheX